MKKVVTVQEVDGEGLVALLDKYVTVWCVNYIYSGKLSGVNDADILLTDACVVYETGGLCANKFERSEPLPKPHYIRTSAIESYGQRGF